MWRIAQIGFEIEESDPPCMQVAFVTPIGRVQLLGNVTIEGRILTISDAHIGGLSANKLGRAGLNALGRKLLEEADVDQIIVQGSARTSGRWNGHIPRPVRFRRR